MSAIHDLVANNKIQQAIDLLYEISDETNSIVNLSGRYSNLMSDRISGILGEEDFSVKMAQIRQSIMYYAGETSQPVARTNNQPTPPPMITLQDIYKAVKRKSPDFGKEVKSLIESKVSYATEKSLNVGYDRDKAIANKLSTDERGIFKRYYAWKAEKAKDQIEKVKGLIGEGVPTWEELTKAWGICQGLRMNSTWIEQAIRNQADDDDVKIRVANAMEGFIDTL